MQKVFEFIKKLESYYGESYTEEELRWIKSDMGYIPENQVDFVFDNLKGKYSNLPRPAKIGKLLYELEFKKGKSREANKLCNCGKCLLGTISVFSVKQYKDYLEMGVRIHDLCELDLIKTGVNCANYTDSNTIHHYLRKIQDLEEEVFQYCYISLWQFYRTHIRFVEFDRFMPYNFWGLKEIGKKLYLKDIKNKQIKEDVENMHQNSKDEFEEFLDKANEEAQRRIK